MPYSFSAVSRRLCTVLARLITFSTPWQAEYLLMASSKQPRHHLMSAVAVAPRQVRTLGQFGFPACTLDLVEPDRSRARIVLRTQHIAQISATSVTVSK